MMLWNSLTAKRATEIARKYLVTEYKFLVYWILKARNVVVNQTRWRSSIFHSTDPRTSATSRFIFQNSMVHSLVRSRQRRIVRKMTDWQTSSPVKYALFSRQMYDANESHDGHAMIFRWLKKKFNFVNGKGSIATVLRVVTFDHVRKQKNFIWNISPSHCLHNVAISIVAMTTTRFIKSIWTI